MNIDLSRSEGGPASAAALPVFVRDKQSLMIVNAKNAEGAEKHLFDNGAEVSFITHFSATRNSAVFRSYKYFAEMVDGVKQAVFELINPVKVRTESYTKKAHFAVTHLILYKGILRKQRIAAYKTVLSVRQTKSFSNSKRSKLRNSLEKTQTKLLFL